MSLPEFLILSLGLWTGLSLLAAAAWCLIASRQTPPPDPDPDSTADDFGDDVQRITTLPPVPLPDRWSEADDAMFAWFSAGRSEL